jgi:hypothetical protein
MALITTAGAADAEAFASVAEYDAYLLARGITNTSTTAVKEEGLRNGTSYLVNQYRDRWPGVRVAETQALPWPRADGYRGWTTPLLDSDGFDIATTTVPTQVKHANIEAARLHISGVSLQPTLTRGGMVKSEQVGPIGVTYMDGASAVDRYTVIEGLLRGLVKSTPGSSSGNVKLERA